MRVGVYIDGFNLYYGARKACGRGTPGWRWLDVRSLIDSVLPQAWLNQGAFLERLVYCTARVSGARNPSSAADQNVYIRALSAHGSVDMIERLESEVRAPGASGTEPTRLMLDVLQQEVDAVVVVSNDSDLKLPVREARQRVPVGVVNPGPSQIAGDLKGKPADGVGGHWWGRLTEPQYRAHQLPDPVGSISKPNAW
jgi:NYN domain-containing protein